MARLHSERTRSCCSAKAYRGRPLTLPRVAQIIVLLATKGSVACMTRRKLNQEADFDQMLPSTLHEKSFVLTFLYCLKHSMI